MPSFAELCAEALPNPGTRGSWRQRLAEGLVEHGSFQGATVGQLDGQGGWLGQLYRALDPRPSFSQGTWIQMLVGGGWPQMLAGINSTIASGDFTSICTNNAADGVYTLNGEPVTIGDIIDLSHPDNAFDPVEDIDAGGIIPRESGQTRFFLKEPLLSQVLAGHTAVLEAYFTDLPAGPGFDPLTSLKAAAFDDPDFNVEAGFDATWFPPTTDQLNLTSDAGNTDTQSDLIASGGVHKIAFTATDTRMAISIDGGLAHEFAEAGLDAVCNAYYLRIGGTENGRLRSFAFYEVVDDADLPTLSAL